MVDLWEIMRNLKNILISNKKKYGRKLWKNNSVPHKVFLKESVPIKKSWKNSAPCQHILRQAHQMCRPFRSVFNFVLNLVICLLGQVDCLSTFHTSVSLKRYVFKWIKMLDIVITSEDIEHFFIFFVLMNN